jgi:predicted dehydrogenase
MAQKKMKNKLIKVGLLGLGEMGKKHYNIINNFKDVELFFISDKDKKKKEFKGNFVKNFKDLLTNTDAIIIATPTNTHYHLIKLISKYVKNIFVEKPIASNLKETIKIVNLIKKEKLNLHVGFIERFNPIIQSLFKTLSKQSRKNKVISFEITRTNALNNRIIDADVVVDSMVHDIDISIFFNGNIKDVRGHCVKKNGDIVQASIILEHYNKVYSYLMGSKISQKKNRLLNVITKQFHIEGNLLNKELAVYKNSEIYDNFNNSYTHRSIKEMIETSPRNALQEELRTFFDSCRAKKNKFSALGEDSVEVMRVCDIIKTKVRSSNF